MEDITIPTIEEITKMSRSRCQHVRLRLKNEISFAGCNAMWGGPASDTLISALKHAIDVIDNRMHALPDGETGQYIM